MLSPEEISQKVGEYEKFLDETLKKDLKEIEKSLDDRVSKHKEWQEVKNVVKTLTEFKSKDLDMSVRFPLGNGVQAFGQVSDYERTYISIGLGYLLEMECEEAEKYAEIRLRSLVKDIEHLRRLAVNVKVNIKMVLLAISELQSLVVK